MKESYRNIAEEASPLPSNPNEAGAFLKELWMAREQHKEKETSFDDITDEEQEEFRKEYFRRKETEPQFNWLAEIFGSEMAWQQNSIDTNYGKVYWFKFGYGEQDPNQAPEIFVFYPDSYSHDGGVIFIEGKDDWEKVNLEEFQRNYCSSLDY